VTCIVPLLVVVENDVLELVMVADMELVDPSPTIDCSPIHL
jgi:hypothetical protein